MNRGMNNEAAPVLTLNAYSPSFLRKWWRDETLARTALARMQAGPARHAAQGVK